MSPAEIQAELNRLGNNREAIQRFLSTVSAEDYAAWARSSQRASSVGGGALETVLGPLLGAAAAPFVGPGAVASVPAAGRQIAGAVSSRMGLGATARDLATLGGATTAAGLATRALTGGSDGAQGTKVTPSTFDFAIRGLSDGGSSEDGLESISNPAELEFIAWAEPFGYSYAGQTADGRFLAVDVDGNQILFERTPTGAFVISGNQTISGGSGRGGGGGGGGAANSVSIITGPDGTAYRVDGMGNVLGSVPELSGLPPGYSNITTDRYGNLVGINNAGEYEVIQSGYGFEQVDPAQKTITNNRTGETLLVNERTGQVSPLGQFDWATIDPERLFGEEIRQYDTTESRLREQMERERGLAETDFISEILRSPADYITSAFLRRGVESGLTPLSQADIISSLREAIIGGPRGQTAAPTYMPPKPPVVPKPQPQVDPNTYSSPGVVSSVYSQPVTQTTQSGRGSQSIGTSSVLLNDGTRLTVDQNRLDSDPNYLNLINQSVTSGRAAPGVLQKAEQGGLLSGPYISGDSPDGKENEEINVPLPDGQTLVISSRTMDANAFNDLKNQLGGMPQMANGGLVPGSPLAGTGGGYVGANGQPVVKGVEGGDWVMVNGQWQPYVAPPPVVAPPPKPAAKPVTVPAYSPPAQYSSATNPLLNITNEQIIDTAKTFAPPGVTALLAGTTEELSPLQFPSDIKVGTPRQMARLTDSEKTALSTRLAAENVRMDDYVNAQEQLYGNQRSRGRGRLLI